MSRRWIEPQDFRDIRKRADLTRKQAAELLDVTVRTIQNWETGGARIPWLAFRMLRILKGYALPGKAWEGWTVCGDRLYASNGRWFEASSIEHLEQVFAMARLWRQDYARRHAKPLAEVFPSRRLKNRLQRVLRRLEVEHEQRRTLVQAQATTQARQFVCPDSSRGHCR